jgi:hypothetical protein
MLPRPNHDPSPRGAIGRSWRAPRQDTSQWRAGWDHGFGQRPRVSPSLQTASGGFWGGSVNLEAGDQWVAGAGLGRTNLRPCYNLNFDPNDSWRLMGAYRPGRAASSAWPTTPRPISPATTACA